MTEDNLIQFQLNVYYKLSNYNVVIFLFIIKKMQPNELELLSRGDICFSAFC